MESYYSWVLELGKPAPLVTTKFKWLNFLFWFKQAFDLTRYVNVCIHSHRSLLPRFHLLNSKYMLNISEMTFKFGWTKIHLSASEKTANEFRISYSFVKFISKSKIIIVCTWKQLSKNYYSNICYTWNRIRSDFIMQICYRQTS